MWAASSRLSATSCHGQRMKLATLSLNVLLAVLLAAAVLVGAGAAGADSSWGRASAPDQTIKSGCRDYRFHYDVTAPGEAWMAELTLVNPHGRKVSALTYRSEEEPRSGAGSFNLCRATTSPGRYRIALKVTSYDARAEDVQRAAPATFRLLARR